MFFPSSHRCPATMSVNVNGVCGCNLDQVEFTNDFEVKCCPEGSALDNEMKCVDNCPAIRPVRGVSGKCGCDLTTHTQFTITAGVLCCPEGQVNDNGACADTCTVGTSQTEFGVCGK